MGWPDTFAKRNITYVLQNSTYLECKEYIYTMIGECIGCVEIEIAQTISGEKIKMVTDSHDGCQESCQE